MNKKYLLGIFAICVSAVLWGFDGVVLTPRLYNLNVGFVVFLLHAIPFLLMNLFLYKEYKNLKKFSKFDYFLLFLIALFGGALGTLAIVKALFLVQFNHLSVVVLLQKLQPIFAIVLASLLLKEKIKKNFALWAVIAITAGYFLTFGFALPDFNTGANTVFAALWSVVAAFSFGSATVFGRKLLLKYNFKTATFYRFGFTTVLMLVFVLITGKMQFSTITLINWMIFLIIAVTTGCGAIFLYYFGLKRVKASVATICELMFPVSAIVFDYFINHTIFSPVQWLAAIVMVGSIVRISRLK